MSRMRTGHLRTQANNLTIVVCWLAGWVIHSHVNADERPIKFNRDVRNLLADRCLPCHGPDEETLHAGLRLDLRENAVEETQVIRPGDADNSELMRRILSTDPEQVMPPPALHKPLSDAEKDVLRRWIDQGAVYESHWAYATPEWPTVFDRQHHALSDVIDHFIQERLDVEQAQAAELADPITLLRRVFLDLTGIPPTGAEVEAFLRDEDPLRYEKLVDQLLASPRYGERMAIYWLDLVRYADTVGYHGDQNISQSPYRDYVIRSFNNNLPYDQFIREQLAGDLLPNPTIQQLVASGYNRLNQTTEEGGSQAKEYLAIYFADRVRNVSQVFMGSTLGCAQCHDHKYDPLSIQDFYALGAFFADLQEVGVYDNRGRPPMIHVPDAVTEQRLQELDQLHAQLEQQIAALRASLPANQGPWEAEILRQLDQVTETELDWLEDLDGLVPDDQRREWNYVTSAQAPVHRGARSRRQTDGGLVQHLFQGVEIGEPIAADTRFFAWVYLDAAQPPTAIMLQFNDGNWEHRKVWGSDDIPYGRAPESHPAYQRAGALPGLGQWVRLEVTASEVGLPPGSKLNGMAFTQFGGLAYWDDAGLLLHQAVPTPVAEAVRIAPDSRTAEQAQTVRDYYLQQAPEIRALEEQRVRNAAERKTVSESAPATVISQAGPPRPIRVLPRGNWMDDSGEIVEPAIPVFFGRLETSTRATRLDFANWLCADDNPLTARTMVNRLWALLFGRGICSSVEDFGGQGTFPSQPELLDALAVRFVDSGWDIKQMVREIVLSKTYRRSSVTSPDLQQRDPYNDWFARQQSHPLLAEMVRDSALSISGLLVEDVGGPSVHPYQPAGYYAQLNFPRREYQADSNANQYRRGVYMHWQRTFLHPMLKAFDAPSREECTAQRARSNTPLQALTLLNDPSFVEAARAFASRIQQSGGADLESKIRWAYREAVSRQPEVEIHDALAQVYQSHLSFYQANPASVDEILNVGLAPVPTDGDRAELAAWTGVARVLLNLQEVITRY